MLKFFLNVLFPISCIHCNKGNTYICKKCISSFTKTKSICPLCNKKQPSKKLCKQCKKNSPFSELVILWDYHDTKVVKSIKSLKYKYIQNIGKILGSACIVNIYIPQKSIITSVPIHKRKFRERGFNQSEIIAKEIAKQKQIPYQRTLVRKKYTKPQAGLKRKQRLHNIQNTIQIHKKHPKIEGKIIILIDDVLTTGTTLIECAKTLKKHKVKQVIGLCLAKNQEIDNHQ